MELTIPGANQPWFFIDDLRTEDGGEYSVFVTNAHGSALSLVSRLEVMNVPPAILRNPTTQQVSPLGAFTLQADADGSYPLTYQWLWNGRPVAGATNSTFTVSNANAADAGVYSVVVANQFGEQFSSVARIDVPRVAAWRYAGGGNSLTNVPANSDDVVAISASTSGSLFLHKNGTVTTSETNFPVLSNVVLIASGDYHHLALLSNGTVATWGLPTGGTMPSTLDRVVALAGGEQHSVALRDDGTVVQWGGAFQVPEGISNIAAIAAGHTHTLALRSNGTIAAWGGGGAVPTNLSNVVAVAGGYQYSVALRSDGTVVSWGNASQTNVPPDATNIVAISARDFHTLALRSDGTVIAWDSGVINVPARLRNVVSIPAGTYHNVVLMRPADFRPFINHRISGNSVLMSVPTELGKVYSLESKPHLSSPQWTLEQTLTGTGEHSTFATQPEALMRAFRIRVD